MIFGLFLCVEPMLTGAAEVSVTVPAHACTHSDSPGGTACGQWHNQHCLPHVAPLPGLSGSFQKDECHRLKNESSFSKAIKDLAKMVNKHAHWYKLGWRAHTAPFSSGL